MGDSSDKEDKGFRFTPSYLIVGVALGAFGILFIPSLFGREETERQQRFLTEFPEDAQAHEADSNEAPLGQIAPAGYRIAETDSDPSGVLRLVLEAPGEPRRLCWFSEGTDREPLGSVECGETPAVGSLVGSTDRIPGAFGAEAQIRFWNGSNADNHPDVFSLGPSAPEGAFLIRDSVLRHQVSESSSVLLEGRAGGAEGDGNRETAIGTIPLEIERFRGCETSSTLAVIAEGPLIHGLRPSAVAFRTGGEWSTPVEATFAIPTPEVTCVGEQVTVTWLSVTDPTVDQLTLHQTQCSPEVCTSGQSEVRIAGFDPMVSNLVDKVILVYGNDMGTRVRITDFTSPDEGHTLDLHSPDWRVLSRHLYVRGGVGVVGIRTAEGIFAHRVSREGEVRALEALPLRSSADL